MFNRRTDTGKQISLSRSAVSVDFLMQTHQIRFVALNPSDNVPPHNIF